MINRENYLMVKRFLLYTDEVMQRDEKTVGTYWGALRHLLVWADKRSFAEASKIRPVFPEFIMKSRLDGGDKPLNAKNQGKIIAQSRIFFEWARVNVPAMRKIGPGYINTLELRRSMQGERIQRRIYYTLEEVRAIATIKPQTLTQERDIAAICFVFLCGIRAGAFTTLPCGAVDIEKRRVIQSPEYGTKTKNSKAAVTFLLPIDDLLSVVKAWDDKVQPLGENSHWYARIAYNKAGEWRFDEEQDVGRCEASRENLFRNSLRDTCKAIGIEYKSPHKLRHGFGVYGVKHAKDIAQLKAISQNLMHANIGITDGIYGKLAEDDLRDIMSTFGK